MSQAQRDAASKSLLEMMGSRRTVSLFLDDKFLDNKMTLLPKTYSGSVLLDKLRRTTKRQMGSEDVEPVHRVVFAAGENVSSRALMDALCALHESRWRRVAPTEYHLLAPFGEEAFLFMPHNQYDAELFAAGQEFFQAMDKLPDDVKNHFLPTDGEARGSAGNYALVGDLPANMQQLLKRMVNASHQEEAPSSEQTPEQVAEWKVQIRPKPGREYQQYKISIHSPDTSAGFRVNLPQPSERAIAAGPSRASKEGAGDTYIPVRVEKPATLDTPLAKQAVQVRAENASLLDVLQKLSEKYNIPLLTDVDVAPTLKTRKLTVTVGADSLPKALDVLAKSYSTPTLKIEWDLRKHGFLVVRGIPQQEAVKGEGVGETGFEVEGLAHAVAWNLCH